MQKWTEEHARLVGRIIFADFLKKPLDKYRCIIEEVEGSAIFERLPIVIKRLSKAGAGNGKDPYPARVIAEIVKKEQSFSIRYAYEGFNKVWLVDKRSADRLMTEGSFARTEREDLNSCLHKLRRISSRNEITHWILKGLVKYQGRYLNTGNPIDLVPFSQIRLADWIKSERKNQGPEIFPAWISRLVNPVRSNRAKRPNGISLIVPSGEEKPLGWFFQSRKDVDKRFIKQVLDKEMEGLESGRIRIPWKDNQIKVILEEEYGIFLSRRTVGYCRREMGIPSAKRRLSGHKYPPPWANFSLVYPLTSEGVLGNAPASPGIYEFRLKAKEIDYPNGTAPVIYVGSTGNIKKRLRDHLRKNNKNGRIREFLKNYECSFRYIRFSAGWRRKERELYELFVAAYGSAPKCNRLKPGGFK